MTRFVVGLLAASAIAMPACAEDAPAQTDMQTGTQPERTMPVVEDSVQVVDPAMLQVPEVFAAPDAHWRTPDPENILYIDTDYGRMIVELYPEIAPAHVERIKTLAGINFYDGLKFHRVIDGFMNQTGDPLGNGTGDSGMDDLPPEFTFRRGADMTVARVAAKPVEGGVLDIGFYKALPIASQPTAQAILTKDGKVTASGIHCKGVTSMARSSDPNTGNSQFFIMRGTSPWLDTQYSIWGRVIAGHEMIEKIKLTEVDGQPIPGLVPDIMKEVTVAASLDEAERTDVQVLDVQSKSFADYLETQKDDAGEYPDICDIDIPVRLN